MFKEIKEIEDSLRAYKNKAFIEDDKTVKPFLVLFGVAQNNLYIKYIYRTKGVLITLYSFFSGFDKIRKNNLRRVYTLERKLLDCDCCWRHACNKNTIDYENLFRHCKSSEKCLHFNCECPCRHLYRKVLWLKESIKLVEEDCPNLDIHTLWKDYR